MTRAFSGLLLSIFSEGITTSNPEPFQLTFLSEGSREAVSMKCSNASHKFPNDSSSNSSPILFLHCSRISLQHVSDISISLMTSLRIFSLPILFKVEYRMSLMSAGLTATSIQATFIKSVIDNYLHDLEDCQRSPYCLSDTPDSLRSRCCSCGVLSRQRRFLAFRRGSQRWGLWRGCSRNVNNSIRNRSQGVCPNCFCALVC